MQLFGGGWTERKLGMLNEYLAAYVKVMKNQPFERLYIDAFAGTGYREATPGDLDLGLFAQELAEKEPQDFFDGSARIALRVEPAFDRYVFIERTANRFAELRKLEQQFPDLADRMEFSREDANNVLKRLCQEWNPRTMRAVLFLDPFGMQVEWTTLESVARTQAIDVWILFPTMAVNRLLERNGKIPDVWRSRLDRFFGTSDWSNVFYRADEREGLFSVEPKMVKTASLDAVAEYYQERLRSIFPTVAPNAHRLRNSRGTALFELFFAAGNPSPKASEIAMRIAQHILGRT